MLDASMEPSAPPAPISVWSSSTKRMMFLSAVTSSITRLIRSSNSPRYFVPATMPVISRFTRRLPRRVSGTSPAAISVATPSATAVLPTPGSPTRHGLFLVRLDRICMTRSISFVRPTTGSSSPRFAAAVTSLEYLSRVGVADPSFLPLFIFL